MSLCTLAAHTCRGFVLFVPTALMAVHAASQRLTPAATLFLGPGASGVPTLEFTVYSFLTTAR